MTPVLGISKLVLLLTGVSGVLAVAQASTPIPDANLVGQVERLGLVGVLILIVIVLWRKLEARENLDRKMLEAVTDNTATMRRLQESVDKMEETVSHNNTVREAIDHKRRT